MAERGGPSRTGCPARPVAVVAGVRVFRHDVDASQAARAAERAVLAAAEIARADRIVHPTARAVAFSARAFLRRLVAVELGVAPAAVALAELPDGKPVLADARTGAPALRPPLRFNVSHSGTVVLVALAADRAVGIDVEVPRRLPDVGRLAATVCTGPELAALAEAAAPEAAFLRLWCAKEAVMKADGRGFRLPPRTIALDPVLPDGRTPLAARVPDRAAPFAVHPVAVAGATAALALAPPCFAGA